MHATGEYSVSDLAEPFSVSRPTVYLTLNRCLPHWRTILPSAGIDPCKAISRYERYQGVLTEQSNWVGIYTTGGD